MLRQKQDRRTVPLSSKELFSNQGLGGGDDDVPYDIDTHLTEINTGRIDRDYRIICKTAPCSAQGGQVAPAIHTEQWV